MTIKEALSKFALPEFNSWQGRTMRAYAVAALYHSRKRFGWSAVDIAMACNITMNTLRMYASVKRNDEITNELTRKIVRYLITQEGSDPKLSASFSHEEGQTVYDLSANVFTTDGVNWLRII